MTLFNFGLFTLHSGAESNFKIDCDDLTEGDWNTLARMVIEHPTVGKFRAVIGIPTGGLAFAKALSSFATGDIRDPILLVDDVLTTGNSMKDVERDFALEGMCFGVVVFARGPCPDWVYPIFQLQPDFGGTLLWI